MIIKKTHKRIIILSLVFLILIDHSEAFSLETDYEFSDEGLEYLKNSRLLIGYNATINEDSDLNYTCWVILEDQGKYDVVWKSVSVNCTAFDEWYYEENTTSIKLNETTKSEKNLTILTPFKDLMKKDIEIEIKFVFYEDWGEKETSTFTLTHVEDNGASFVGFGSITLILIVLSIIRKRKSLNPQRK